MLMQKRDYHNGDDENGDSNNYKNNFHLMSPYYYQNGAKGIVV